MARKHTEDEVLRALRFKNDVRIIDYGIHLLKNKVWDNKTGQLVTNHRKKFDVGNSSWGKIDFLTKHCGYHVLYVNEF
jgi:hypothetical protein